MGRNSGKLVCGIGLYDSDEPTATYQRISDGKYKRIDANRPYNIWRGMLQRCYKPVNVFYLDVKVCDQWHKYSNFKQWYTEQEGQQGDLSQYALDKDLINGATKLYSPENCVFIPDWLNLQLIERGNDRGEYPLGVCKYKNGYISNIGDGTGKTKKYLGFYKTPEEAHSAWQLGKISKLEECLHRLTEYNFGDNTYKIYGAIVKRIDKLKKENIEGIETKSINQF